MNIAMWLARGAAILGRFSYKKRRPSEIDDVSLERMRLDAARALRTRLPLHLRRDVGADDG
jgi:hypothetical protein